MKSKYEFFWDGIYSQWYQVGMSIDGIAYNCCEQYMMHQKALFFGDLDTAAKILQATSPRDQKQLGRQVKGFDGDRWNKVCFGIVFKGNYHKFTQNPDLKAILLSTEDRILVEASPFDQIWGIGLGVGDNGYNEPMHWRGQNLLGWAITLVKQELK